MCRFTLDDFANLKETPELIDYLNTYPGVLPILLRIFTNASVYEDNLKKLGIYDEVMAQYYEIRLAHKRVIDKHKFRIDELFTFIKNNPEAEEILLRSAQ